jgi:septum formation inhibitor MinC
LLSVIYSNAMKPTVPPAMPHRRPIAIGAVVTVLLTGLQLPLAAGAPPKAKTSSAPHDERLDLLYRLRGKGGAAKVSFGRFDAWVAKYAVGPDGTTVIWKKQLGTSDSDVSNSVATDSKGNVFVTGYTFGALAGVNQGERDAWVAKYSPNGTLLWKKQLGTSKYDRSNGVAADSSGNVFISGTTLGALAGDFKGRSDAWVAKLNTNGKFLWKKQLGTSSDDTSNGVATDSSGHVFISGDTTGGLAGGNQGSNDAWVAKYSPNGTLLWKKQLGSPEIDVSNGVATDSSGNVLISGRTTGALAGINKGERDAWVAKYSPNGKFLWKKQLGTSGIDVSFDVATDNNGKVLITGGTTGALTGSNQGALDAWVAKYKPDGNLLWKRQLGTSGTEFSSGATTDSSGNVFISGITSGALAGSNKGEFDAWFAQYSSDGTPGLRQQVGTPQTDFAFDVATDNNGHVLVTGFTEGKLGD